MKKKKKLFNLINFFFFFNKNYLFHKKYEKLIIQSYFPKLR
jgi:hypothetical protein